VEVRLVGDALPQLFLKSLELATTYLVVVPFPMAMGLKIGVNFLSFFFAILS
jgi:hypothetical protein